MPIEITSEDARRIISTINNPLEFEDGKVSTAEKREDILDHIVNQHSALTVDQAAPLNCCRTGDIAARKQMTAPLMLDAVTANMLLTVRKNLHTQKAIDKFRELSWTKLVAVCWKFVK